MRYRTKMYKRTSTTVDTGTMGFHDYETRYQPIEEFFDMVNKAMDDLRNSGAKKISVQYLTETHTQEINRAIITYMI